jgi:hypothetical protein
VSAHQIAGIIEGLIPLSGGILACLFAFGGKGAGDPRWAEWRLKYATLLKVCGPLMILFGLFQMALPFAAAALAQRPVGTLELYPTKPGSTWVYAGRTTEITSRIPCHEVAAGILCARRELVVNGKVVLTDHLRPEQGVMLKRANKGLPYVPPFPLVKEVPGPVSWDYRSSKGTLSVHCEQTDGGTVQTPMGTFEKTVLVTMSGTDENGEVLTKHWYARGVGLVREYNKSKGKEFVMELKSYTP